MPFLDKIKPKLEALWIKVKPILSHSRNYKKILPVIFIGTSLLILAPSFFDNSGLKFRLEKKIAENLKTNFEISGKVDIALFPTPAISLNDVFSENYILDGTAYDFYAKNIKIKTSFFAFFLNNFSIKEIIFSDAILRRSESKNSITEQSDIFTEALQRKKTPPISSTTGFTTKLFEPKNLDLQKLNATNLPRITLENANIITYDKNDARHEVKRINGSFKFSKKAIYAHGEFLSHDILNNFEFVARFNSKHGNKSYLKINSAHSNFKITGDFSGPNHGLIKSDFHGILEGEIFNIKDFYKSYISDKDFIYNKLNPLAKPLKISTNINNNGGEIIFDTILLNSNFINGGGNIIVDLSSQIPLVDIRLDLENLDMNGIWVYEQDIITTKEIIDQENLKKSEIVNLDETVENSDLSTNITENFKNFDLTCEITINRLNYLEEEINNIDLYTTISKNGQLLLLPLTLELQGGGLLRMNGVLENDNILKFVGKIDISGDKLGEFFKWLKIESQNLKYDNLKEYSLYSDIMITPDYASLDNLYLNINKGQSEILGEVLVDYSRSATNILSDFKISELNLNEYFLISGQNAYLSPGELLKKLLWLNEFSSNNDLTLSFNKLNYEDLTFQNQSIKMRFGQGYFEIVDLKLKSDDFIDLNASLSIDITGEKPRFDLSVSSDNFYYKTHNDIKNSKIIKNTNIIDQFFALPSLEGFYGNINLKFKNSTIEDLNIENIAIEGKIKNGIIDFSKFNCDIYGGSLDYTGSTGIKFDKTISGNLNFSEVKLSKLLKGFFNINNIDGTANISSSITSIADKKADFLKNLTSEIKFNAANVNIEKYGLNDLVRKMFNPRYYINDLRDPQKILFNPTAKTTFRQASGNIFFSKAQDNKFKVEFTAPAVSGIFSGKINLIDPKIDGAANIIFLTGDRKKQTPINIASNIRGPLSNMLHSTNIDQVKQYLGLAPRNNNITQNNLIVDNNSINAQKISPEINKNLPLDQQQNHTMIELQAASKKIEEVMQNPDQKPVNNNQQDYPEESKFFINSLENARQESAQ